MESTEDDLNRRDVLNFFCCVMFPFIARIADPGGVAVPRGLRKLKALHTLGVVNIAQEKTILKEIKRLNRLHKLSVTGIDKKNCQEFCSTLAHLSCLESLSVHSREDASLRGRLDGLRSPPRNLQSLNLQAILRKLPEWIVGLQNLVKLKIKDTKLMEVDGTIQVLGKLPNLSILGLLGYCFQSEESHLLYSHLEAFPSLTVLELDYPGIRSVVFDEGTTPRLEVLCFRGPISFSGLSSLPTLKEVLISKYDYNMKLAKDVRAQLTRNPNKPVLKLK